MVRALQLTVIIFLHHAGIAGQKKPYEMVPTLRSVCLTTICTNLWRHGDAASALTTDAEMMHYFPQNAIAWLTVPYTQLSQNHELILSNIMSSSTIPIRLRLQIAIAFLAHSQKMVQWTKNIKAILKHPRKPDIQYALEKTIVTQYGEIDTSKTVLKILVESYYRVKFKKLAAFLVCINDDLIMKFLDKETYLNEKVLNKVKKEFMCCDEFNDSVEQMIPTRYTNLPNSLTIGIGFSSAVSLQVWQCLLDSYQWNSSEIHCQALVQLLLNKNPESDRIIHFYEQLSEDHKITILKKFSAVILKLLFNGEQVEYCVQLYSLICQHANSNTCLHIMGMLIEHLSCDILKVGIYDTHLNKIRYWRRKSVFLNMWKLTPIDMKQDLIMRFQSTLWRHIVELTDFNLLSILVCDKAYSKEETDTLVLTCVLFWAERSQLENNKKFLRELPSCYDAQFIQTNAKYFLKQYIAEAVFIPTQYRALTDFAFEFRESADEFRKNLFMDKQFVVQELSKLSHLDDRGIHIIEFLRWGSNDDHDSMKQFIDDKIKSENWLLDIYKLHLLNKRNAYNPLLNLFTTSDEEKSNLKKTVREDKKGLMEIIDRAFVENKAIGKILLRCMFDKAEKKQKCAAVEGYFSSELGIKRIHEMLCESVSICNTRAHFYHVLADVIETFYVFKKHWRVSGRLIDFLDDTEFISNQSIEEYIGRYKRDYLPCENNNEYYENAMANLRIFTIIMSPFRDTKKHLWLTRLKQDISLIEQGVDTMLSHLFSHVN